MAKRGPGTTRGKAATSRNALKHGQTSSAPVIPGKSPGEWQGHPWAASWTAFSRGIRHGRRRAVRLEEVPVERRAPVLKAYPKWALGARPLFEVSHKAPLEEFEGIAQQHPVFRIVDRSA